MSFYADKLTVQFTEYCRCCRPMTGLYSESHIDTISSESATYIVAGEAFYHFIPTYVIQGHCLCVIRTSLRAFIIIYTVSGKKRPQYLRHNFDKFRHSLVIFGTNHPDTSMY